LLGDKQLQGRGAPAGDPVDKFEEQNVGEYSDQSAAGKNAEENNNVRASPHNRLNQKFSMKKEYEARNAQRQSGKFVAMLGLNYIMEYRLPSIEPKRTVSPETVGEERIMPTEDIFWMPATMSS
jgi:hypothetical protein